MKKTPLDVYDDIPRDMRAYLQHYGWHFSKRACGTRNSNSCSKI